MRYFALPLLVALLVGCTTSNVARFAKAPELPAIPEDSVRVYSDTSSLCGEYTPMAEIAATGTVRGMEKRTEQEAITEAADMGANALVRGKTVNQGASFRDYAGNTIRGYAAVRESRPCRS